MLKFIVVKTTRLPTYPGYSGYSCEKTGVIPEKVYDNKDDAISAAKKLNNYNPVGFSVFEVEEPAHDIGRCVYGLDMFSE